MPTLTQGERTKARDTSNIRIFTDTILDLNQHQVDEQRRTGSKPSHAELVERAVREYLNRYSVTKETPRVRNTD